MSLTYGFYDSLNHDRVYNAEQMSSIFDGIITDGILETYGNGMSVSAGGGMQVLIASGRAWFDHTWSYNDAEYSLTVTAAHVSLNRIDAVVLEVNANNRENTFKMVNGTPATSPVKPSLTNDENVHQYALAYVTVPASATEITASGIENNIGTSSTPYCTGVLTSLSVDTLIAQWRAEYADAINEDQTAFDEWLDQLHEYLSDDVAATLATDVATLKALTKTYTSISVSSWTQTDTYEDYPFRGTLACSGVSSQYSADVRFSYDQIAEGIFGPITDTSSNTVYIYASEEPSSTVTVPVIICTNMA